MNYNFIAPYYDFLSRICFFNQQQKAHELILNHLKRGDKVLWLGGGSGWFLKELENLNIRLSIDYVEFSEVMIKQAQRNDLEFVAVDFYHEDFFQFIPTKSYDVVITAFVFDHFSEADCQLLFDRYDPFLQDKGKWIQVDFIEDQTFIQRFLTRSMVLFFRLVANCKTSDFPRVEHLFKNYRLLEKKTYFFNYIVSKIYQK